MRSSLSRVAAAVRFLQFLRHLAHREYSSGPFAVITAIDLSIVAAGDGFARAIIAACYRPELSAVTPITCAVVPDVSHY